MRDLYFYIILFLFLLNFVFLITLANFIVRLAEGINKTLDFKQQNKTQEDKGLIDI